jgi:hypothetical protein
VRIVPTLLLLIALTEACAAQQAPAPPSDGKDSKSVKTQPPPKDQKKAPPQAADQAAGQNGADQPTAQAKSKLPPPSTFFTELGYADWGLSGDRHKFLQYGTPPAGWFVRDLRYSPMFRTPTENAFFDIKGIGQNDYRAETRLAWSYGATQASGFLTQSPFFDPTPAPIDPSYRRVQGFNVSQALSRDFALSFRYRNDSQQNRYESPQPPLDQTTQYLDAVAGGKLGPGYTSLSFSNLHYSDHTGSLVNTHVQTLGLRYLWEPCDAVGLEAAFSHAAITQPELSQSHLDTYSLTGDFALGSATDLNFLLQRRELGLPNVQSAFVRSQGLGTVTLFHRWRSWRAQLGLRLQNDDRVNGDQTNIDVPKWSTVEGRLSGRLGRDIRFTLRGYSQTLTDPPSAITMDPRSLYWNGRDFVQAKLEGGRPDLNGYLVYTYRANRDSARSSEVQTTQFTAGSVWQVSPTVNLFAEYHHESWSGKTDIAAFPTLSGFMPDTSTGIVELTWNLGRLFLSSSYTGFAARTPNPLLLPDGNTHGSFFTLTSRYRFPAGYELGLTVAPWAYHDSVVSALNYNAAIFMLTGSARF